MCKFPRGARDPGAPPPPHLPLPPPMQRYMYGNLLMMMMMMMSYSKYINEECHTNLEVLGDIDFIFTIFKKECDRFFKGKQGMI